MSDGAKDRARSAPGPSPYASAPTANATIKVASHCISASLLLHPSQAYATARRATDRRQPQADGEGGCGDTGSAVIAGAGWELDIGWPKDPVAFLAWINAEQVIARLHEQIKRLPAQANALSAAERSRRMTEITARILELEHEEEALVEAPLEKGHDGVSRREGVSPAVVLGVRVINPARAAA